MLDFQDRYRALEATLTVFDYDGLLRLRRRREFELSPPSIGEAAPSGSEWVPVSESRYIYDGRRVIQERDTNNTPTVAYTRGSDLSGSLEGAGGIGGLLARGHGYSVGTWSTHNYYHADGNGNVTYLVDNSQGLAASYRYDPYGNLISSSGPLSTNNVYRFSSKEVHVLSGMYYYLYRFYDPNLQRWVNRDPLSEPGFEVKRKETANPPRFWRDYQLGPGPNRYLMVGNAPISQLDCFGLATMADVFPRLPFPRPPTYMARLSLCMSICDGTLIRDMAECDPAAAASGSLITDFCLWSICISIMVAKRDSCYKWCFWEAL